MTKRLRPGRQRSLTDASKRVILDDLDQLLRDMLAETGGPLTKADRRTADRILRRSRVRNA